MGVHPSYPVLTIEARLPFARDGIFDRTALTALIYMQAMIFGQRRSNA